MINLLLLLLTTAAAVGAPFQLPRGTVAQTNGTATNLTVTGGTFSGPFIITNNTQNQVVLQRSPIEMIGYDVNILPAFSHSISTTFNEIRSRSASGTNSAYGFLRIGAGGYAASQTTAIDLQSYGATDAYMMRFSTAGTERMRISSGNVGIGTQNPQYLLDLNGQARATSTNAVRFGGSSGDTADTTRINQPSAGTLQLTATNTTATGNLAIAGAFTVGLSTLTTNTTLSATSAGAQLCATDAGAFTVTLPAATAGKMFTFVNLGTNTLSIAPGGSDTFLSGTTTNTTTKGGVVRVLGISSSAWSNW